MVDMLSSNTELVPFAWQQVQIAIQQPTTKRAGEGGQGEVFLCDMGVPQAPGPVKVAVKMLFEVVGGVGPGQMSPEEAFDTEVLA